MTTLFDDQSWKSSGSGDREDILLLTEIRTYVNRGGRIFVGTDSMYVGGMCIFATVIAMHSPDQKIAKYYYKRIKEKNSLYDL